MKCVVAEFVPWLLLPEEKEHLAVGANDLIQTTMNEPDFLKKILTGDESWVYGYDLETKVQSPQWKSPGSPCPDKAWQIHSKIKTTLTRWEGVAYHESPPPGQTVNKEYYLSVLRLLRDAMQ